MGQVEYETKREEGEGQTFKFYLKIYARNGQITTAEKTFAQTLQASFATETLSAHCGQGKRRETNDKKDSCS